MPAIYSKILKCKSVAKFTKLILRMNWFEQKFDRTWYWHMDVQMIDALNSSSDGIICYQSRTPNSNGGKCYESFILLRRNRIKNVYKENIRRSEIKNTIKRNDEGSK